MLISQLSYLVELDQYYCSSVYIDCSCCVGVSCLGVWSACITVPPGWLLSIGITVGERIHCMCALNNDSQCMDVKCSQYFFAQLTQHFTGDTMTLLCLQN